MANLNQSNVLFSPQEFDVPAWIVIPESISGFSISGNKMSSTQTLVGAGKFAIFGAIFQQCFLANLTPAASVPTPVDPPSVYTFCNSTSPYGRDYLNLNLKMIRDNDYSFDIAITLNGAAVNLAGGTLRMTAKWQITDPDNQAVFSITSNSGSSINITNAAAGTANVTVPRALTTNLPAHRVDLVYDIQLFDNSGKTYTVMYGTLTVLPNVSITAP